MPQTLKSGILLIASLMERPSLVARDLKRSRKSTTGKLGKDLDLATRGTIVNVKEFDVSLQHRHISKTGFVTENLKQRWVDISGFVCFICRNPEAAEATAKHWCKNIDKTEGFTVRTSSHQTPHRDSVITASVFVCQNSGLQSCWTFLPFHLLPAI